MKSVWEQKKQLEADLKLHPTDGELWLDYAFLLEQEFILPEATISAFEKAQQLLPHQDLRLWLGRAYYQVGNSEKAIQVIMDSIADDPRPEAFCTLANLYWRSDDLLSAREACEKSIEIDSTYEEAYYLLGKSWRDQQEDKAISYYRKAIELDPDYQSALRDLGSLLTRKRETRKEGIGYLEKVVKKHDDGWAYAALAMAYWREDEIEKADVAYRHALECFPEFGSLYKWYGEFLSDTGREIEAARYQEIAETLPPD